MENPTEFKTDLERFMKQVGANLGDVAQATGLTVSTVSRLKDGKTEDPGYSVVRAIWTWADGWARRLDLPLREYLRWP